MTPRAKTDALAERERLLTERRSAEAAFEEHAARVRDLEREDARLNEERIEAYARESRGQEDADVNGVEKRRAALRAELDRAKAAQEGARRASDAAGRELEALLRRELDAFVAEAEEATQEAVRDAAALEQPYRKADESWRRAEQMWAPLRAALMERVKQSAEEDGFYYPGIHIARISSSRPFPLGDPSTVFPIDSAPRPAALEAAED